MTDPETLAERGRFKLLVLADDPGRLRLLDVETGACLDLDERELFWLNVIAGPLGVAVLRRPPAGPEPGPAAAQAPEVGGGPIPDAQDRTDLSDGQLLLAEQVEPPKPKPLRRRAS